MRSFYKTRTQTADQTPFDNSTNGFNSITVQDAIEETLSDAINNDRYPIQASYNGNATSGRYLEIFPGESSDLAPLYMPSTSYIVAITIQASTTSNGSIQVYNITTDTVIYTASYAGASAQAFTGLLVGGLSPGNLVAIRTSGASINKPKVRIWFNTSS